MISAEPAPPTVSLDRRRRNGLLGGFALALVVMLVAEVLRVFVGQNPHMVVKNRCYRGAQPFGSHFESILRTRNIRTVINLRGDNPEQSWYWREKAVSQRCGVAFVDAGMMGTMPTETDAFRFAVKSIDEAEEPILFHCYSGSDRTGLASAIYLLLRTDTPLPKAWEQLHWRYGHLAWGRARVMNDVLADYADWLRERRLEHRREHFLTWTNTVYHYVNRE